MFRLESEKELRECFRPLDRDSMEVPRTMTFPVYVRDYLAWGESSGVRTFLVFSEPESGKHLGVSFRRNPGGITPMGFCQWCHSTGSSVDIGLLTADASARKRVGVHVCLDLRCIEKLEARSNMTGENSRLLARAVIEKMAEFARQALF